MPRLNDQPKRNNMPNNYTVNVTVTVTTWPGNNGDITAYSIAIKDSDTPAGFLSCDTTGHFTASMAYKPRPVPPATTPPSNITIGGPVSPGDQIVFKFSGSTVGSTVYTVTDIGGLNGLVGGLAWGQKSTANGATSITATVTAAPVTAGTTHAKYSVVMQRTIAGSPPTVETATIDPDFETDVT